MSLKQLVEQHNRMNAVFGGGGDDWTIPPTPKMAQAMFQRIDSNLSPEVIYMDGERRGYAAQRFKSQQEAALKELKAFGFTPIGQTYNL